MENSGDGFYLGLPCHKCRAAIEIIIDDASDPCQFVADDLLRIVCLACGHTGHYQTKNVVHYPAKHAAEESNPVPVSRGAS